MSLQPCRPRTVRSAGAPRRGRRRGRRRRLARGARRRPPRRRRLGTAAAGLARPLRRSGRRSARRARRAEALPTVGASRPRALCAGSTAPPPPGLARLRAARRRLRRAARGRASRRPRRRAAPYQRRGVGWLVFLREARLGALLADDMGLGKTLQALCAFDRSADPRGRCPTSVLPNWAARDRALPAGAARRPLYHGPGAQLDPERRRHADDLRAAAPRRRACWQGVAWDTVVLDEAQVDQEPRAARSPKPRSALQARLPAWR
ncbi:MAG: hypothetical protein MZU84_00790 [Sphingobacterium sp.]|nr:hypothetical protein [Sphingobacterium sp.]